MPTRPEEWLCEAQVVVGSCWRSCGLDSGRYHVPMRRPFLLPFALTLLLAGWFSLSSTAAARCAVVMLPEEVQSSPFVVEAVLERAGGAASFRTVTVWKGGTAAPARFTLSAQQGRGRWPWADSANEGKRYLLFLSPASGGFTVARCGQSGVVSDSERAELRAEGLTPTQR